MEEKDKLDSIRRRVIGAAIEVHRAPIHEAQLLSYLRLSGKRVGLLINFHVRVLKNGLKRIVNEFPDSAFSAVKKEF
jgi:hypothetical protein